MSGTRKIGLTLAILFGAVFYGSAFNSVLSHEAGFPMPPKEATRREVTIPIADFSLTDQAGKAFELQKLRGKVVLVSFIYTSCPDVCPLMTASMRQVQSRLSRNERQSVHFLSITTEPEIDSAKVLKSYGERFKADFSTWSFLTGKKPELVRVWKTFGVNVQRKAPGLVSHTSLTALLDKKGVMRYAYYGSAPDEKKVAQDMRRLIAEP